MLDKLAMERDETAGRVEAMMAVGSTVGALVGTDAGINVVADVGTDVGALVGINVGAVIEGGRGRYLIV